MKTRQNLNQGLTLTFQLDSQVAGDILDATTMSVCLRAKPAVVETENH